MEKKVVAILTVIMAIVTVTTCFLLLYFNNFHSEALAKAEEMKKRKEQGVSVFEKSKKENSASLAASFAEKGQVRIRIPENVNEKDVLFDKSEIDKLFEVIIPNVDEEYFEGDSIIGAATHIEDLSYYYEDGKAYLDISTDSVYECKITCEEEYVYLKFVDPHDVYNKVVVIDAGHGGVEVGATRGNIYEKDIDLGIVLKLKEILDKNDKNIKAYYTRLDDSNPSLESRVLLANDSNCDCFLSVHNNSLSGSRMSSTSGTQVVYYTSDPTGKSKEFSEICLSKLCEQLGSNNRGLVDGDDILIVHNSKSPVALVEVGFMTNPAELVKLSTEDYQIKAAQALYESILEMIFK